MRAKSMNELCGALCDFCPLEDNQKGFHYGRSCDGEYCDEAYENYLEEFENEIKTQKEEKMKHKKVIFSGRTTVVIWEDGTKTIVKCTSNDVFDKEKGYLMALFQKITGLSKKQSSNFFKSITEEK